MTRNYLDILAETIRNNWDAPALTDFYFTEDGTAQDTSRGNHYTYGEMYTEICRVANGLHNYGLRKGDHIAICGENSSNWIIAYLAIAKLQGVAVVVMPTLPADQIIKQLKFADSKGMFIDCSVKKKLKGNPIEKSAVAIDLETLKTPIATTNETSIFNAAIVDFKFPTESPALLCYTSGSTETPKAVLLPNRSMSANVDFLIDTLPDYQDQHALIFLTLSHVLGLLLLTSFYLGCHTYVLREELTPETLMIVLMATKPYLVVLVPLLAAKLMEKSEDNNFYFIKYFLVGGAQVPQQFINHLLRIKIPISIGYGQTETGAMTSLSTPNRYRAESVGTISATTKIRISPAGEILVKGENVMLGYYKDPESTARKIDSDGWLHTGDKGHLDEDGYLYVEGRLEQDIIVLPNGENIRPDNIESLINALPEVSESIVLAREGKLVAIVVPQITNDQSPMTNTDLRRIILRNVNPSLPLYSQLYDVEITDKPLQRTEKQTIKRYLYS